MPSTTARLRALAPLTALALTAGVGLTACGSDDAATDAAGDTSTSSTTSSSTEASSVTVTDPWVKAVDAGDMTAMFGTLTNDGDADAVLVSATTEAASMVQLHETVETDDGSMQMQEKDGGFDLAAGDGHELAPGGDHVMLMGVSDDLLPGDTVTVTLTFEDDSTLDVDAVVKEYTGADEEYSDGMDEDSDMSGTDMSEGSDS
ncbi:copper chaperone PCu(A)C [Nocardioides bruguierae]|uniref:Copper chaperone PCu(A)C n=1 Tax=Nocardioides bruguierae TaxID=2945102 RepID=A0A9X2D6X2_9ACTN|nr:copper chaperone PCu(A)C [Nocardioides bruguierae]MCM0620210.1 copper chaperone PCu(A)C [Nocardioides bruguierae]